MSLDELPYQLLGVIVALVTEEMTSNTEFRVHHIECGYIPGI
jgi:hypothetical protein